LRERRACGEILAAMQYFRVREGAARVSRSDVLIYLRAWAGSNNCNPRQNLIEYSYTSRPIVVTEFACGLSGCARRSNMYALAKTKERTDWELVVVFGGWIVFEIAILTLCLVSM
jgi:hypothetical protein